MAEFERSKVWLLILYLQYLYSRNNSRLYDLKILKNYGILLLTLEVNKENNNMFLVSDLSFELAAA
jgi:hypothetical protein